MQIAATTPQLHIHLPQYCRLTPAKTPGTTQKIEEIKLHSFAKPMKTNGK